MSLFNICPVFCCPPQQSLEVECLSVCVGVGRGHAMFIMCSCVCVCMGGGEGGESDRGV